MKHLLHWTILGLLALTSTSATAAVTCTADCGSMHAGYEPSGSPISATSFDATAATQNLDTQCKPLCLGQKASLCGLKKIHCDGKAETAADLIRQNEGLRRQLAAKDQLLNDCQKHKPSTNTDVSKILKDEFMDLMSGLSRHAADSKNTSNANPVK